MAIRHIHKYKRIRFKSGHTIFRCMLPGCSHFIREELLQGREAICWKCKKAFIILTIELKFPHCENCYRGRKKEVKFDKDAIDILMSTIGG